eukprot:CAMPEP_0114331958 /NCGR_PEP_ID=MMETSP0101-20121206/2760_1 /TAXON_ID=38822 ORGANISM="Pteridomonas danica, Strain PT" /NCGR_SAMPLE_ID=MMETSP0101 /ASSEMBLY_ACC=CAM_ASM_000211 /LENGTH=260 /DNA_ID=CAMNT_0001462467 /DNA_START=708 /DNA_END=1486 /DNA_ORIENTATION=-
MKKKKKKKEFDPSNMIVCLRETKVGHYGASFEISENFLNEVKQALINENDTDWIKDLQDVDRKVDNIGNVDNNINNDTNKDNEQDSSFDFVVDDFILQKFLSDRNFIFPEPDYKNKDETFGTFLIDMEYSTNLPEVEVINNTPPSFIENQDQNQNESSENSNRSSSSIGDGGLYGEIQSENEEIMKRIFTFKTMIGISDDSFKAMKHQTTSGSTQIHDGNNWKMNVTFGRRVNNSSNRWGNDWIICDIDDILGHGSQETG